MFTSVVHNCILNKVDQKTSATGERSSSRLSRLTHQLHGPRTPATVCKRIGTGIKKVGATACNVNACNRLGHTDLHLAVSLVEPATLEFVKLPLDYPQIDILLQRSEIDVSCKDLERYNLSVRGIGKNEQEDTDLLTWEMNRNTALGVSNRDNHISLELMPIPPQKDH